MVGCLLTKKLGGNGKIVDRGAEYSVIPFLKSQGVKRLDEAIITHAHEDHFGDLLAIAQKVPISVLYFPKGAAEANFSFRQVLKQLQKAGQTVGQF